MKWYRSATYRALGHGQHAIKLSDNEAVVQVQNHAYIINKDRPLHEVMTFLSSFEEVKLPQGPYWVVNFNDPRQEVRSAYNPNLSLLEQNETGQIIILSLSEKAPNEHYDLDDFKFNN